MRIYTQYCTDHPSPSTVNNEPSMTLQSFRDEVDINNIIDRYTATGELVHVNGMPGVYADVSVAGDYADLMNNLAAVTRAFEQLPDEQQREYGSPEAWLEAALTESVEDGLIDQGDSDNLKASVQGGSDPSEATGTVVPEAPDGASEN